MNPQDISFYSGDSRTLLVTVNNSAGQAVNITGAQAINYVIVEGSLVLLQKSLNNGVTLTNPTTGNFSIQILATDTPSLSGTYIHQCRLVDESGNSSIIFTGTVTVTAAYV